MGIYAIVNKVNGKYYIGGTNNIHRRWWQHKYSLSIQKHRSIYLQRAYNQYGIDNFEFKILDILLDKSEIPIRERYWFDVYKPYLRKNGYNVNPDPETWVGRHHTQETIAKIKLSKQNISEETRMKMSASMKGRPAHFKGKHHTEYAKQLMRERKLGKKLSDEHKEKLSESHWGIVNLGFKNGNNAQKVNALKDAIQLCLLGENKEEVCKLYNLDLNHFMMIFEGKRYIKLFEECKQKFI